MAVSIRERNAEDLGPGLRFLNELDATRVLTEAGFRHRLLGSPPEARRNWWAAQDDAMLVGWASASVAHETTARGGYVVVAVLPSHRGRGLGTALLERALAHLEQSPRIHAETFEDGRGFAERHGFRHTRTRRISGVDPRLVDTSELDSSSVEVVSLLDVGPEQTFAVDAESVLDEPGDESIDAVEYDQWLRDYWAHPDLDFGVGSGAVVDGRAVAIAMILVDLESRRAFNAYTGTLRAYRGRGLARLAKLGAMRRLAQLGVTMVLTENDEANAAMLAINERLGYRPVASRYSYVLDR
jgi:GNAT superfamily N-acetyltransferase